MRRVQTGVGGGGGLMELFGGGWRRRGASGDTYIRSFFFSFFSYTHNEAGAERSRICARPRAAAAAACVLRD